MFAKAIFVKLHLERKEKTFKRRLLKVNKAIKNNHKIYGECNFEFSPRVNGTFSDF